MMKLPFYSKLTGKILHSIYGSKLPYGLDLCICPEMINDF